MTYLARKWRRFVARGMAAGLFALVAIQFEGVQTLGRPEMGGKGGAAC